MSISSTALRISKETDLPQFGESLVTNNSLPEIGFGEPTFSKTQDVDADLLDAEDQAEAELGRLALEKFVPSLKLSREWISNAMASGMEAKHAESIIPKKCKAQVVQSALGATLQNNKICIDPWSKTKNCSASFQIPGYRLGDLFYKSWLDLNLARHTTFYFPGSIGDVYWRHHKGKEDYKTMNDVIDDPEYQAFERPDEKTLVIHVRGGDVALASGGFGQYYSKSDQWYKEVAAKARKLGFSRATIVTGDHRVAQTVALQANNGTASGQEPILKSIRKKMSKKLDVVRQALKKQNFTTIETRIDMNADCDFIYMAHAKAFVPSGGGFTTLAAELVKIRGNQVLH